MKNATIFHGTAGTPNHFWFPYVKNHLEKLGYEVWLPQLPDTRNPDLSKWLPYAIENGNYDEDTILIGHSAGDPLILSILENIDVSIHQAILVAGFTTQINDSVKPILQKKYNWEKIKAHCKNFYFINSDNDPWGCDDKEGRIMFDNLGGTQIIKHGDGHMGSEAFNQPYKEFPLIPKLIEAES